VVCSGCILPWSLCLLSKTAMNCNCPTGQHRQGCPAVVDQVCRPRLRSRCATKALVGPQVVQQGRLQNLDSLYCIQSIVKQRVRQAAVDRQARQRQVSPAFWPLKCNRPVAVEQCGTVIQGNGPEWSFGTLLAWGRPVGTQCAGFRLVGRVPGHSRWHCRSALPQCCSDGGC